jgi:hypothetical protein
MTMSTTMGTYYETRAVRWDKDGPAEPMERFATLGAAILDALKEWPEDDRTDIEIHGPGDEVAELAAKVQHLDTDPAIAFVTVFEKDDRDHFTVSEYYCKYIEIFGRVHTNITPL